MKLAVAIDGSDNAFRAAERAIGLARLIPSAELHILYVVDFDHATRDHLLAQNDEEVIYKREKHVRPVQGLAEREAVPAHVHWLKGKPSDEIIRFTNEESIDQLFIGSRGLNTLQEMVFGSVSHQVMKKARCPITIVK